MARNGKLVTGQGQEVVRKQAYYDPVARLRYSTNRRSFPHTYFISCAGNCAGFMRSSAAYRESYAHATTCGGYITKATNLRATIVKLLQQVESRNLFSTAL